MCFRAHFLRAPSGGRRLANRVSTAIIVTAVRSVVDCRFGLALRDLGLSILCAQLGSMMAWRCYLLVGCYSPVVQASSFLHVARYIFERALEGCNGLHSAVAESPRMVSLSSHLVHVCKTNLVQRSPDDLLGAVPLVWAKAHLLGNIAEVLHSAEPGSGGAFVHACWLTVLAPHEHEGILCQQGAARIHTVIAHRPKAFHAIVDEVSDLKCSCVQPLAVLAAPFSAQAHILARHP